MQSANRIAFKEWAVICEALAEGKQSLVLRKGGIHEGREGFRVQYREFWLFPTRFHQQAEELAEEAHPLLQQLQSQAIPQETTPVSLYAVVNEVIHIEDESLLPRLSGLHLWSEQTIHDRFHYRKPGLFALPVRVYRRPSPFEIPNSRHFAGCRSWIEFPEELSTEGLQPVLTDDEFEQQMNSIRQALAPTRYA